MADMGTGVIFGVVVVGFLAYLVPWFITRQGGDVDLDDQEERFASSMTLIRRGTSAFADADDPLLEVSTPATRRAALADVAQTHARAATRRQRAILALLVATVGVSVAASLGALPWWSVAIPGGLVVGFLLLARFSVVTLNRHLDERVVQVESGWEHDTIIFEVPADLRADTHEESIELSVPVRSGSLWDEIPVTAPTYISKPLVPRTVRTIDLSAPLPAPARQPVLADATDGQAVDDQRDGRDDLDTDELPRAVNE